MGFKINGVVFDTSKGLKIGSTVVAGIKNGAGDLIYSAASYWFVGTQYPSVIEVLHATYTDVNDVITMTCTSSGDYGQIRQVITLPAGSYTLSGDISDDYSGDTILNVIAGDVVSSGSNDTVIAEVDNDDASLTAFSKTFNVTTSQITIAFCKYDTGSNPVGQVRNLTMVKN